MTLDELGARLTDALSRFRRAVLDGDESAELSAMQAMADVFAAQNAALVIASGAAGRCPKCAPITARVH